MREKPTPRSSLGDKELDKAEAQFDAFEQNIKDLTLDRMNEAPQAEIEPQTKLSQNELNRAKEIYLKPKVTVGCREKFNEKFRDAYTFDKEYVNFIAENKEIIGESIDLWTKPYAGVPAEEWIVPVNKPVWGPRYLAEQIRRCTYHKLIMNENRTIGADSMGTYQGEMVVDQIVPRLTAEPVIKSRSVFMGSNTFKS